jgi:hypothetical protein
MRLIADRELAKVASKNSRNGLQNFLSPMRLDRQRLNILPQPGEIRKRNFSPFLRDL